MPDSYNYIAAFLTFDCGMQCSYCINRFGEFNSRGVSLTGKEWVSLLNRISAREGLPVTLQGGEPSAHEGFIYIINNLKPELDIDILTNLQFDIEEFIRQVNPLRLKRDAPYASIRVSLHPEFADAKELIGKTLKMMKAGFSIGIWAISYPGHEACINNAREECVKSGIDFRIKEFLGKYDGDTYGTYKYPGACDKKTNREVLCKTSELIIGPDGSVYRCHSDLYENRPAVGHMADNDFQINDEYRHCGFFGHCNPCDVKIKTDRFQHYGHTSVEIK